MSTVKTQLDRQQSTGVPFQPSAAVPATDVQRAVDHANAAADAAQADADTAQAAADAAQADVDAITDDHIAFTAAVYN